MASALRVSIETIRQISRFSSCDVADALIKLNHPNGGYLPDINLQTQSAYSPSDIKICGEAFTVQMVPAADTESPRLTQHYVDAGEQDTVMVISSPPNSKSAVWGGLMTARAKAKGIKGVVIDGRCRDLVEHRAAEFMIFARGHSILGQSTFTRPSRIQVPITIFPVCDRFECPDTGMQAVSFPPTVVNPHDIILGDEDGVVAIPHQEVDQVIKLCAQSTLIDQQCLEALNAGHKIADTFAKFRGK
ncbi:hypothetical protein PCANC_12528 [Puccinia coronata f. sp. avenae]|uniref:RraA-like protein n=1 Tax=Puccinia coronata f. sp. avenae TaxID=200324 RepID=A0A2N5VFZ0_9BASI|nr:hypothetical protein PCANC_12528 [Puccinia coronata f. sp. avenae]PLW48919.1 hypothetical protein PCASD_02768 [Puccinia coronata f. sp. avenae]